MDENFLTNYYKDIQRNLLYYINNKRIIDYKTPFIVDKTYNEDTLGIFYKYPSLFTVIDGKKMHLDKCFRKIPLLPILEEARRSLVNAMINNRTLVIRLGDSATDFLNTFHDDNAGAILGIIENDIDDNDNDNDSNSIESKIEEIEKFKNEIKLIENKNKGHLNDHYGSEKSSDWRSFVYNDDEKKSDSTFIAPFDNVYDNDNISMPDFNTDIIDETNDEITLNHGDSHHHHERNKADARVEGGPGSFGSSEGLGLFNPRPPYKPYSYFPKHVLINGGLGLNRDFWKDRLYRREDKGYGQGNVLGTLYDDEQSKFKTFNVIVTSTHDVESLETFLFNGKFGLPDIHNFNILTYSNDIQ